MRSSDEKSTVWHRQGIPALLAGIAKSHLVELKVDETIQLAGSCLWMLLVHGLPDKSGFEIGMEEESRSANHRVFLDMHHIQKALEISLLRGG